MNLIWLYAIATSISSVSSAGINLPDFNIQALGGNLGFLGSFSAISLYRNDNQSLFLQASTSSSSKDANSLYLHNSDTNTVQNLGLVDGPLLGMHSLNGGNVLLTGDFNNFSPAGGSSSGNSNQKRADAAASNSSTTVQSPVIYNYTSGESTAIFNASTQINGTVKTVLVDNDLIYLGGDFVFNNTHAVAIYNTSSQQLYSTPFEGFGPNSAVYTIAKILDDSSDGSTSGANSGSIVFGGSFDTLGFKDLLKHNVTGAGSSNSSRNSTNTSLITAEQIVSLKHGTFSSVQGDPATPEDTLICPETSQGWSVQPNEGGEWEVELAPEQKGLTPTKVRLYLPELGEDAVKLFRIYSYPNSGIMNLSYVDPQTNEIAYCDAWCPLASFTQLQNITQTNKENANSISFDDTTFVDALDGSFSTYYDPSTKTKTLGYASNYQEFSFEDELGINSIGLTVLEWYGNQGKLQGFELYLNAITVYGDNSLNQPNCASIEDSSNESELKGGNWQNVGALATGAAPTLNQTNYLVTEVTSDNQDVSVTFLPNISYSGDYSILMYTPGCTLDNSCNKRSIVNVTLYDIDDSVLALSLIYQNNLENKFDYLFYGHLNGSSTSDGAVNKIVVTYDQPVIAGTEDPWFVIDRVVANIVSLDTYYGTNSSTHRNSTRHLNSNVTTISLNGLFEYSLANFTNFDALLVKNTTNTFVGNSSINYLSGKLLTGSNVTGITQDGSQLIISGDFNVENSSNKNLTNNILTLAVGSYNNKLNETDITTSLKKRADTNETQTVFGIQFNKLVTNVVEFEDNLIFIGDFVGKPVNGVNVVQLAKGNSSSSSGDSVNNFALYGNETWYSFGNPLFNEQFTNMVNLTIDDVQYFIFQSPLANSNQVWDFTNLQWVTNSTKYNLKDVSAALSVSDKQQILGSSSSFNVMDLYNLDQATITQTSNNSLTDFPFNVTTGTGLTNSFTVNSSLSILTGNFTTSDGIENVLILRDNSTSLLKGNVEWGEAAVEALYAGSDTPYLFIGTNDSITVDGDQHSAGVVIYNLEQSEFNDTMQPAELTAATNGTSLVSSLAVHDSDQKLVVGGNFIRAGSLDCPGFCIYDMLNTRWVQPTNNNSISDGSVVTSISFYSKDDVLITGNITFEGQQLPFISYDFVSQNFAVVPKSVASLSSNDVERLIVVDDGNLGDGNRLIAQGPGFVSGFDGSSWNSIDQGIDFANLEAHTFTDMKLVQLAKSNSNNNNKKYFDQNQVLMLAGAFSLENYGLVNAAIYDGANWIPYVFTTQGDQLGVINSILVEDSFGLLSSDKLSSGSKHMSTGKVVGISLACAIGSTALLSLLYLVPYFILFRKNRNNEVTNQRIHENDMLGAVNPEDLIHEIDVQKR